MMMSAFDDGSAKVGADEQVAGSQPATELTIDSVETEFGSPLDSVYRLAVKHYKGSPPPLPPLPTP
jgi:hypothetical protein